MSGFTGILIPNLPNEVAFICLARVPRQHHHTLANVSNPIRSAVTSSEFFETRSRLGLTDDLLYMTLRSPYHFSPVWFALHRQRDGSLLRLPVPPPPPHPRRRNMSATIAHGHKIYLFGGWTHDDPMRNPYLARSSEVWVLNCRSNTWSPAPDMLVQRSSIAAAVLGEKIYVFSRKLAKDDPFGEVLDTSTGRWEALPDPPIRKHDCIGCEVVVQGQTIRVWLDDFELRFNTAENCWDEDLIAVSPRERGIVERCMAGGALFGLDWNALTGNIKRFDEVAREWKAVEGTIGVEDYWIGPKLASLGDSVMAITGRGAGQYFWKNDGTKYMPPPSPNAGKFFEAWYDEIDAVSGRNVRPTEMLLSKRSRLFPPFATIYDPNVYFNDWNMFKISL